MPSWTEILSMSKNTPQGILDTNVLVRAFLKTNGSDGLIFEAFRQGKFNLLYSDVSLKELVRVLNYPRIINKYHHGKKEIDLFVQTILTFGKFVYAPKKVKLCRDPDDDELISIALAIYVKRPILLVTGDKDLLALKGKIRGVKIVTAAQLAERVLDFKIKTGS